MNPALQPFLTVALPIIVTLDVNRRFDEATDRIERKFDSHEERIVRLEERTSPIHR